MSEFTTPAAAVQSPERATHVRVVHTENITHRDRRSECYADPVYSMTDVAISLDRAAEESIDRRGASGLGAGAYLEAIVAAEGDDPDECDGETVESVDDPLFAGLPPGDPAELREFIAQQKRSSCWDGHNRVPAPYYHSEALLCRIRGRRIGS